jgi:hypothetical protein
MESSIGLARHGGASDDRWNISTPNGPAMSS